ncbi:MAG: DNA-directed RNA polymerase subunit alpha C-terminal domain-containing protein [Planctomycetota bacterium]
MSTAESVDIERALGSAMADVGEALHLRRRVFLDADLHRGLRGVADGPEDGEDAAGAARRATANFLLDRHDRVGPDARRSEAPRVLYLWALAELYLDRPVAAIEALKLCVEMEPRFEPARLEYAASLALLGRPEEARKALGDLARQADRPQVLYVLGAIAESEGNYAEARERYETALSHDPEHLDSLFRLAYQHDLSGDDDAAIALYERARRIRPTRVNILVNLGVLYEDRDEFPRAAECYREVMQIYPQHARAKSFLRDAESSRSMVVDEDMERKEDRRNQLLRTPISDFELSVRSRNCLAKMNISSLGDLITRTEAELLSYKNFGETSLQEIKDILVAKGLRLGMRREEVLAAAEAAEPEITLPDIEPAGADAPEQAEAMAMPISDLDLSIRSAKAVATLNAQTVGDLAKVSESDLLKQKNFGSTSLSEIKAKLAKLGLNLQE